jgi:hypothetical protein
MISWLRSTLTYWQPYNMMAWTITSFGNRPTISAHSAAVRRSTRRELHCFDGDARSSKLGRTRGFQSAFAAAAGVVSTILPM